MQGILLNKKELHLKRFTAMSSNIDAPAHPIS
jgi:hypothetical protein